MLLAIDTATKSLGLALYDGISLHAEQVWQIGNNHNALLASTVASLLATCDVAVNDLTAIAVAKGPGNYRHLRTGIAYAKGIAVGKQLPLIGISTLDIIASAQTFTNSRHRLFCVLQSSRERIIAGEYRVKKGQWRPMNAPEMTTWDDLFSNLNKTLYYVAGEVDETGREAIEAANEHEDVSITLVNAARGQRRAGFLAHVAWERYHAKGQDAFMPAKMTPTYVNLSE